MVKSLPPMWETRVWSLGKMIHWRRKWQPTPIFLPGKSHGPKSLAGYSPWSHKESGTTEQLPFLSFCSLTLVLTKVGLPGHASGKEPNCQCRRRKKHGFDSWVWKIPWRRARQPTPILAWRIPWTEEPGGLQSIRSQRDGHNWSDLVLARPRTHTHTHTHTHPTKLPWNFLGDNNIFCCNKVTLSGLLNGDGSPERSNHD